MVRLRNLKRQGRQLPLPTGTEICLFGLTGVRTNGSNGLESPNSFSRFLHMDCNLYFLKDNKEEEKNVPP